jgi:glycerol uptake facilitator-like aquaporin
MIKVNFRSLFLEFSGTFFIVFTCSFGFTVFNNDQIDEAGLALLNGFVTMIFVWLSRNATMAQFNPILTLLLLLIKKIKVGFVKGM